jgi:hypothetical protein
MRRVPAVAVVASLSACLSACMSAVDPRPDPSPCDRTTVGLAFISDGPANAKARIEASARTLTGILASDAFAQACRAAEMNRTRGKSVADVCSQLACAGPQTLKIALYDDPDMRTVAFEKRDAVFINTAKDRAGTPQNLAHELAHALGYSHRTCWGWRRKQSVPYVLGRIVEEEAKE